MYVYSSSPPCHCRVWGGGEKRAVLEVLLYLML